MKKSLYEVLRIKQDATQEVIKAAYIREYQKGRGETELFNIQAAHDILIEPEKRHKYDAQLAAGLLNPPPVPKLVPKVKPPISNFMVVFLLLLMSLMVAGLFLPSTKNKQQNSPTQAWTLCEQFVSDRLKAPSTADFSGYSETTITGSGLGPWKVSGYVDSQNSFGAKLRSRYSCVFTYEGETAHLQDISIH